MKLSETGSQIENYLSYLTKRQTVIASNIANADTPGYRTQDIVQPSSFSTERFADVFHQQTMQPVEVSLSKTQNDGNNVDLDREARLLAENTLRFNLASQMLKSDFKSLRMAIEEGKSS